ncbi:MAG: DegV family protein [Clostridia bacterium]|nr:DegV family protein [Clostridia bacterium]
MMVKLLIDSAADIGAKEAETLGVTMLPLVVSFGDESYYDGVELSPRDFYEKLIESDTLPKTSQITPFRFDEAYANLTANGDEVVAITISSKLSGTYGAAVTAAENYAGKVFVVDSLNAAIGERLLVQYALRLIEEGKTAAQIAEELEEKKKKVNLMAVLGTLEYLKKGGRISSAVAFAGELLSIKPVIAIVDGEVKLVGKAMGSKKGNNLLNTLVQKQGGIDFSMPYGVVWSGLSDEFLKKYVKDSAHLWERETDRVPSYMIGGTIGAHVGPGAIGVAFFSK